MSLPSQPGFASKEASVGVLGVVHSAGVFSDGPQVVQCQQCKVVVGDSTFYVCSNESLQTITLRGTSLVPPSFAAPLPVARDETDSGCLAADGRTCRRLICRPFDRPPRSLRLWTWRRVARVARLVRSVPGGASSPNTRLSHACFLPVETWLLVGFVSVRALGPLTAAGGCGVWLQRVCARAVQ